MKVRYGDECQTEALRGKTVAVIGYGRMGSAFAQNLRESGVAVRVSARPGSARWAAASADGFPPAPTPETVGQADVVLLLTPDDETAAIFQREVAPHLRPEQVLGLSSGITLAFHLLQPPPNDLFLLAPRLVAHRLRSGFQGGEGSGALFFYTVVQDAAGRAEAACFAVARAVGGRRSVLIQTTPREEAVSEIFGEQAVFSGGVTELVRAGYETLVAAGHSPEMAYFESLYELKSVVDSLFLYGPGGTRRRHSVTCQYGELTRGPRVITPAVRRELARILSEVEDGSFIRELILEKVAGRPTIEGLGRRADAHALEAVHARMRELLARASG